MYSSTTSPSTTYEPVICPALNFKSSDVVIIFVPPDVCTKKFPIPSSILQKDIIPVTSVSRVYPEFVE